MHRSTKVIGHICIGAGIWLLVLLLMFLALR